MIKCPVDFEPDIEVGCGALLMQMMAGEIFVMQKVGPELSNALFRKKIKTDIHRLAVYKNINISPRTHGWNLIDLLTQPKTFQHNGFEAALFGGFKISGQRAAKLGCRTFISFGLFLNELFRIFWTRYIEACKDLPGKYGHPIMSQNLCKAQPVDGLQIGAIIFVAPGISKLINETFFGR